MDPRASVYRLFKTIPLCVPLTVASYAAAQTPPAPEPEPAVGLEEIVVTAQKREESLQDTPISVVAFTSQDLENRGIGSVVDLRSSVPNLQLTPHPNSATTVRLFIRGVGNNDDQITMDPSVAVYLDGVYVARNQGLAMEVADIERIEVLRGPQGTLYGRNATGGAINFITLAPELGKFGFKQNFTVGNQALFTSRTQANLPLGEEAAVQLSYLKTMKDGFVDNLGTGVSRFGDQDRDAYRAALLWQPADALDVRYSYDRSEIGDTPAFIAAVPFYPATAPRPEAGSPSVNNLRRNDVVAQGHNLTASWQVTDALTLKSITGYRELDNETYQDYHSGVLGPVPIFITSWDSTQDQFSQELQAIGSALDERFMYVAGLYYLDESADSFDSTNVPGRRVRTDRTITIDNSAYALYAQGTYTPAALDGRLHVTAGARWSQDDREATLQNTVVPGVGAPIVGPLGSGDNSFDNVSPSLIVGFDVQPELNVYAKAVKGYKTGGFNVRASSIARFEAGFDEENLMSYELGMKSQWWDNRVRLNTAVFYADYDDIQVNVQSDPTNPAVTDVFNAGKAEISGVELDLDARLTSSLGVTLSYAYLDADYSEIINAAGVDVSWQYHFVEAPRNSVNTRLQYDFPELSFGQFSALVDYAWQGDKYSASNDSRYVVGSYGLLNARLNLTGIEFAAGELRAALWGRNLTDEEYYVAHFNAGVPSAIFGEPRSYGIDLIYQY